MEKELADIKFLLSENYRVDQVLGTYSRLTKIRCLHRFFIRIIFMRITEKRHFFKNALRIIASLMC